MNNPRHISITTDTFIRALLVFSGAALIFFIRDIILIILVAVVIASSADPSVRFFVRYKIPRVLSAGIVYTAIILVFGVFFYFFVPVIISQVTSFLTTLPEYSSEIAPDAFISDEGTGLTLNEIARNVNTATSVFSGDIISTVGVIFGGLFNFILIFTIAFYLSTQKNGVAQFIQLVSPVKYTDYVLNLWARSQEKISKWFNGMVIASLLVGVMTYIGLLLLGIQYAFFFALLVFLLNFIPIIGPNLAAIPAVIVGIADGGLLLGVLVAVLYIVVQALENNVFFPLVLGKAVGVSPIAIIVAIGIGSKLAGFLGVILAVPLSGILIELLSDVRKRAKQKDAGTSNDSEVGLIEPERHG